MALMKYNTAHNKPFVTPTCGLYPEYVTSMEEFKDRNAKIMKNCWIDTSHGSKGEKIYELYNPDMDGEIVKESPGHSSKCVTKVTCRSSSRGHKTDVKGSLDSGRGKRGKTSQTLSESRQEQYGITTATVKPRSV